MELFKRLAIIGETVIVDIFDKILFFFNTPVRVLLNLNSSGVGIITQIIEWFGFDLSLPLWEFMLVNVGIIIVGFIILRLLSFIRG